MTTLSKYITKLHYLKYPFIILLIYTIGAKISSLDDSVDLEALSKGLFYLGMVQIFGSFKEINKNSITKDLSANSIKRKKIKLSFLLIITVFGMFIGSISYLNAESSLDREVAISFITAGLGFFCEIKNYIEVLKEVIDEKTKLNI